MDKIIYRIKLVVEMENDMKLMIPIKYKARFILWLLISNVNESGSRTSKVYHIHWMSVKNHRSKVDCNDTIIDKIRTIISLHFDI